MKLTNLNSKQIQHVQLSVLKRFADFCEARQINYLLCGGSMLGAVRHKGFIPWDDDIDIMMPRPDYNRFKNEFYNENLEIFHYATHKDYNFPFIKLGDRRTFLMEKFYYKKIDLGIHIDVFPIDGMPENEKAGLSRFSKMLKYRRNFKYKLYKFSPSLEFYKKIPLVALQKLIPIKFVLKQQQIEAEKYNFNTSPKAAKLVWGSGKNQIYLKSLFTETQKFPFEGFYFNGPKYYDTYLKSIYGDYKQLPPKDKQVSHHHFDCGIKEGYTLDDILKDIKKH